MDRLRVNTEVIEAEIFLKGAMVKRKGIIELEPGINHISILGLTKDSNENTVKIELENEKYSNIEITSYSNKEHAKIIAEANKLIGELEHKIQIKEKQKDLWTINSDFSQREKADYEEISRFISNYADNVFVLEKELDDLKIECLKKRDEVDKLVDQSKQKIINFDIESDSKKSVTVLITYFENYAKWEPVFELYASEESAIIKIKGKIIQKTIDVWKDVKLSLSTGTPTGAQEIPEISPNILSLELSYERRMRKYGRTFSSSTDYCMDESYLTKAAVNPEERMLSELNEQRVDMDTTTSYNLNGTWTIDNRNDGVIADLYEREVLMSTKRVFVPKRSSNGYLAGEFETKDLSDLNKHNVEVYFNDNYVGKIYVDLNIEEEKNLISLGIDEKLKTTRKEETTHSKGFKNKLNKKIIITLSSSKQDKCQVLVRDFIPKSADKELIISNISLDFGKLNEDTNIVEWDLNLIPGNVKILTMEYEITYPLKKVIEGF